MRFKWVPEPPESVAAVGAAQQAISLIPASESDCLRRLVERTDKAGIDDRETAREWLTFLRALGLVEQVASGYRRSRGGLSAAELGERILDAIYGAREIQDALLAADRPLSVAELNAEEGVELPTWERHHHPDHQQVQRRRVRRLAEWFVLCGVADREASGYVVGTESPEADS